MQTVSVSVPSILYHYTSAAGLLGILETSSLWASNIHYLNDSKEFRKAIECADQMLCEEGQNLPIERRAVLLNTFRERLDQVSEINILVASLSENGDLLSQWRGYCPAEGGYSIGVSHGYLGQLAATQGFRLLPCSYSEQEHQALIRPHVKQLLNVSDDELDGAIDVFLGQFIQIAPILKHPSFAEEREWRLVSGPFSMRGKDWLLRPGRSTLIPYAKFDLGLKAESAISEVIVGPMPHQKLAGKSVGMALNKASIRNWTVHYSLSPYRNW